ncbi:hypothetical protein JCM3775_006191 [Rhodotorula graminis]
MSGVAQPVPAARAASTSATDDASLLDSLSYEVVNIIIAHVCPPTTITLLGDVQQPDPLDDSHNLLAVRSTCRLFRLLCQPFVDAVYGKFPDEVEASTQQILDVFQVTRPRARRCRKLVLAQTTSKTIEQLRATGAEWATVFPALNEVVLSGTATFDLSYLPNFDLLAHLDVANQAFCTSSPRLTFPSLVSLNLNMVNTKQCWLLTKKSMPALRHLSIGDIMVKKKPSPPSLATTDLLGQLESLEIGEDTKAGSDTSCLIPILDLPPSLPVLWRINLDSTNTRPVTPSPRRTYVRIDRVDVLAADDVEPRLARLTKLSAVLAALPDLELVFVPRELWAPSQTPSMAATAAQQALKESLKARGVEVRAFDPDERGGASRHLAAFLRERATATRVGRQGATRVGRQGAT